MAINFNAQPYHDDYSEDKKFYKILFRPGYAVQARELNQLQTILQKQIERQGNHLFKEGAMVIPGQIAYDDTISYVKLSNTYGGVSTDTLTANLVGKNLYGKTSGVVARVLAITKKTSTDPSMIYVKYISSGFSGESNTFTASEVLTTEEASSVDEISIQVANASLTPFGLSAGASVQRGVYYVKGNFVLAEEQTIILSKFSSIATAKVGFNIIETLVTPEADESLLDNAADTLNYAAPGAHRYGINLVLTSKSISDTGHGDFIELLRVRSGKIEFIVNKTDYAYLEETLARRTYDESGNYVVRGFNPIVREYRSNNRGSFATSRAYLAGDVVSYTNPTTKSTTYYKTRTGGVSSSTATTGPLSDTALTWELMSSVSYNNGVYPASNTATFAEHSADEAKLAVGVEAGKGYIFGYEIEQLVTKYASVDKARDTVTETDYNIPVSLGQYIIVDNINYLPDVSTLPVVTFYNRYTDSVGVSSGPGYKPNSAIAVGTGRIRAIEYHPSVGETSARYKVFLFDIAMNNKPGSSAKYDFGTSVKQLFVSGASAALSFSADILPDSTQMTGTVTSSNGTTIVGTLTKFLSEFSINDYVNINGVNARVTAIATNYSMTVSTSVGTFTTGQTINKHYVPMFGANSSMIFPLPNYAIQSINLNDVSYKVYRVFTGVAQISGGDCIVSLSSGSEFDHFESPLDPSNYVLTDVSTGATIEYDQIDNRPTQQSIIFTIPSSHNGHNIRIIGTIRRNGLGIKNKTLVTTTKRFTTLAAATASKLFLGKADGYKLISVKKTTGTFATPGSIYADDITANYTFNDGQTDAYYGISFLSLNAGKTQPNAPIEVTFQYFNHVGDGDFFAGQSYTSTIPYGNIPVYSGYALRDCIDFRPRVTDNDAGTVIFSGNNDNCPKFAEDFIITYTYYLARKTKVFMNKKGELFTKDSASSLTPSDPIDAADGMSMYQLTLEPYTFGTTNDSVVLQKFDNKRYTMKDIGSLDRRISNLEYYTSLSLLETNTSNLTIQDADGLERFKNGFVVDNFSSHNVGDSSSSDYLNSMDFNAGELRPYYTMECVDFSEVLSNNTQRSSSGYQLTGDMATVPYTQVSYINQPLASTTVNVNPFAIFTFLGHVDLTPPNDTWVEIIQLEDNVVQTVMGNYNTINTLAKQAGILGTVWNAWQTTYRGTPRAVSESLVYGAHTNTVDRYVNGVYAGTRNRTAAEMYTVWDWDRQNGTAMARTVTKTITATQINQVRTGTTTTIQEKLDREVVNNRLVSSTVIPNMRSKKILVQARGLKPNTVFYPYFDGKSVGGYCTPAEKITFTPITGQLSDFDSETNVGDEYRNPAREFTANTPELAFNVGDVVYVSKRGSTTYNPPGSATSVSPVSAVVVGEEVKTSGERSIYVVNTKDSITTDVWGFVAGDTITGTVSGAKVTIGYTGITTPYTRQKIGNPLVTNINGAVNFVFDLPNTTTLNFRSGTREFTLLDINTYNPTSSKSSGSGFFSSEGQRQSWRADVKLIRNAELIQTPARESRTFEETTTRTTGDTGWWDPLAQTFLVEESTGVFVTKVDVFFSAKPGASGSSSTTTPTGAVNDNPTATQIPVKLQIVETVNGYPSQKVVPLSSVTLTPNKVNVSANASVATTFTFKSPLYLSPKKEYALILMSDSNDYKVWVAKMGEKNTLSDDYISKQPYAGVFFKSQNASTWTAEQEMDLKFNIHRAKFTTNSVATIDFENKTLTDVELTYNPLQFTEDSNVIRVNHISHGMHTGGKVRLRRQSNPGLGTIYVTNGSNVVMGVNTAFDSDLIPENTDNITSTIPATPGTLFNMTVTSTDSLVKGMTLTKVSGTGAFGGVATVHTIIDETTVRVSTATTSTAGAIVFYGNGAGAQLFRMDGTLIGEVDRFDTSTPATKLYLKDNATFTYGTSASTAEYRFANPIHGISPANLFKEHTISNVELDSYTITVSDYATNTIISGGSGIFATRDIPFECIHPNINTQLFETTPTTFKFQGITSKSVNGTQTPYSVKPMFAITNEDNNYLSTGMTIASLPNANASSINVSGRTDNVKNSSLLRIETYTTNEWVSPVIDMINVSMDAISNKVNKPSSAMNVAGIDDVTVISGSSNIKFGKRAPIYYIEKTSDVVTITTIGAHGFTTGDTVDINVSDSSIDGQFDGTYTVTVTGLDTFTYDKAGTDYPETEKEGTAFARTGSATMYIDDETLTDNIKSIISGKYIVLSGSSVTANNGTYLVTDVAEDGSYLTVDRNLVYGTGTIAIVMKSRFVDEITPVGSSTYSKYVTRKIQLAYPSTFLKIRFAAAVPPAADIGVYYKLQRSGLQQNFDFVEYVKAKTDSTTFVKTLEGNFSDVELDLENLPEFDALSVKLVMTSSDNAQVPVIKDLRIIACA